MKHMALNISPRTICVKHQTVKYYQKTVTGNLGCVNGTLAVKNLKQQVPEVEWVTEVKTTSLSTAGNEKGKV